MPVRQGTRPRSRSKRLSRLASKLLEWYSTHARQLPWRGTRDPYRIWVSEIMLQQTRVETVAPYYRRWMRQFPSVRALALAPDQTVLRLWEGLGYYARARNLHRAARIVVKEFGGDLPSEAPQLRALPGIGRYSAGAIASIAFGRDEPALDANARRALARIFAVRDRVDGAGGSNILWGLAALHLPKGRAGDFNQALMDLGALVCIPRRPLCKECPLSRICLARRRNIQDSLPTTRRKKRIPLRALGLAVIRRGSRVMIARRPPDGLLGGMWEFPNVRLAEVNGKDPRPNLRAFGTLQRNYGVRVRGGTPLVVIEHAYTHFRVEVHAYVFDFHSMSQDSRLRWTSTAKLASLPMGKVDRRIAHMLTAREHPPG